MTDAAPATPRCRLLLFSNTVQIGGMEEHVRLIAQELNGDRFEVLVVMPDWEETNWFADRVRETAAEVTLFTPDRRSGGAGSFREALRLIGYIRRSDIDVAHLHSTSYDGLLLAILAVRIGGVRRVLVTEHLSPSDRPSRRIRWQRRLVDRLVDGIVAVSAKNRDLRLRHLGGDPARMHVVNNGIDVHRFDRSTPQAVLDQLRLDAGISASAEIVGTAIRLEPDKGVLDLIDAFGLVLAERPNAHLVIAGDGGLRTVVESRIEELGLADHVTLAGFVADPRPLIDLMDVFVIPVPFGSASIALLEAMAMSKPCIISFGGEGEAVEHGRSGFWAEPNEPSSIAEHVVKLLADDELRRSMAEASYRRVATEFSSAAMADELAELYLAQGDRGASGR